MSEIERPHDNCYVVPGHNLIAGEYPFAQDEAKGRRKLATILDAGVTCFLDLTGDDEFIPLRPYAHVLEEAHASGPARHVRLSVRDNDVPTRPEMVRILDTLDDALRRGDRVYLHCWGGVGRTGTVVGCFLVRHGMTGDAALAEVERLYRTMSAKKQARHVGSPETERQRAYVRGWREAPETPTAGGQER